MVYESCYWKDDLRSYAKELRDFSTCTTLEDKYRDYRLEKALLLSAFTVRLLLDANKLSDRIGSLNLKVDFYPAKIEAQKNISPFDKRFIDERYFDLANPTSSSISLRQLTNQLIHSALISSVLKTPIAHPYTIGVDTIRCGPRGDPTFRWRPQGCPRFLTCPARPAASRDRRMT